MTLERREESPLETSQDELPPAKRRVWMPSPFELLIAAVLIVVWSVGIVIVIRHEDAGFGMSVAYVLLGVVGAAVSWLLLWPLLRITLHWMDE